MTHVTKSVSTAQYTCTTPRGVDCMYVNCPINDMKLIHNPVKWSLRENALIVNQILLTTCNSFKEYNWDQCGEFVCGYWIRVETSHWSPAQQGLIFIWVPSIAKHYSKPNSPHPSLDEILVHHSIAPNGMLKKNTQNQRPVRGEVKWEIVSWLRSKWLWATKLGKNYVVSKIYIRCLMDNVTFLPDI